MDSSLQKWNLFATYSQTQALLFLQSATENAASIFAYHPSLWCQDSNPRHISRVAPDWDLGRTLYQLSYSATAYELNLPDIAASSSPVALPAAVPRVLGHLDPDAATEHVAAVKVMDSIFGITKNSRQTEN